MRRISLCLTLFAASTLTTLGPVAASAQTSRPGTAPGPAATAIRPFPNDQAAFAFFTGKGLADFQAAGIIGNLDVESHDDPAAVQKPCGAKCAHGIAQWQNGQRWNHDRHDNMLWYAGALPGKPSATTLNPQLEFIWYELTTFPKYGLKELRAAKNADEATTAFTRKFEQCGKCKIVNRLNYARIALRDFTATAYVLAQGGDFVTPFNVANDKTGEPIGAVAPITAVAAPDGKSVYIGAQNAAGAIVPGSVIPIDVATNKAGKPIKVGAGPRAMAITPSGKTVYVGTEEGVWSINTATDKAERIDKAATTGMVMMPGGATVYAISPNAATVTPIRTATNKAEKPIKIKLTVSAPGLVPVLAPNGKHIYIFDVNDWTLITINTGNNTANKPIDMQFGVTAAVITPGGGTIYGIELDNSAVVPINPSNGKADKPIATGLGPLALAITRDGRTVYVANFDAATVTPISTASNTAGKQIPVDGDPFALTFSPAGQTLYVSDGAVFPGAVTPIDVGSNKPGKKIKFIKGVGPIVMVP
ncbi:MAG TPA: phage tail tip lysozyme [Streptosporangiaceae bacterium]|nr:phage tail tip lysozyme [Streptosporangiaceae bacterium]